MTIQRSWCDETTSRTGTTTGSVRRGLRGGVVTLGVAGAVVATGGIAYAVWTSSGTGTGSAAATSFQAVTVSAGTAPAAQLYPGLTADGTSKGGDLVVTASNPNPFPVTVAVTSTGATGCTTPAVSLLAGTTFTLAASASNQVVTLSKRVSMGDSSNDCQSKTITVSLSTTSTSS